MSDAAPTTAAPAGAAPAAPAAPAATAPATPTAPAGDGGEVIYRTQQDFDRAFGERLGRERSKLEREFNDKLEATKTSEREAVAKEFHGKLVNSTAESIATSLGFHDPKDALAVIDKDKLPIKDGEPDSDAIKKALEDLVKAKPYLVKDPDTKPVVKVTPGKPKLPNGNPDPADKAKEGKMSAAEALRTMRAQSKH